MMQVKYAFGRVHPHIVQLLDIFTEEAHFVIVVSLIMQTPMHQVHAGMLSWYQFNNQWGKRGPTDCQSAGQ